MDNVGYAALQIIPSFKGMDKNLERGLNGPMSKAGITGGAAYGDAAGKSAGSRFNRIFVGAAKVGLAGAVGVGAVAFKLGKDAIAQASDLNESLNAVNVTYGKQADAVKKLGVEAATSLGLSNTEFNGLAVQFSAFATQVAGGEGPKVIGVLDELTTRGSDFASVMNLEVNEALGLFQSGLAGETEPLRKFGIDLSAAAVEAHALKKGITDGKQAMTEAEKVQGRYSLLMEQTAKSSGDFANTSDSLANSQRILSARWDNAQAKLGQALLPVMEDLVGLLLDKGIPAVEKFGDWFAKDGIDNLEKFGGYAKDAAGFVKDLVGFLNDIPNPAKIAGLAAALGGAGALKFRGGGSGALGTAGRVLGAAKPVPVFVTNPGFDGAGGAGGGKAAGVAGKALGTAGLATGAGAAGVLGTLGIYELSKKLAPDTTAQGNFGTPSGGPGIALKSDTEGEIFGDMWGKEEEKAKAAFEGITAEARAALNKVAAEFEAAPIPDELKTDIALNGVPQSMAQAKALVKQYDLTPKEKRTLFEMAGLEPAKKRTQDLIQQYNQTPAQKRTMFEVDGIEGAISRMRTFSQELAGIRSKTISVNTVFTSSGNRFKDFGPGGNADGGTIPGQKYPYGDKVLRWLAPGEEVISNRHGQADRNRALLKAINAGRMADGGTVAGQRASISAPRVSVGGSQVQVFIDGQEIRNIAVREANRAINSQLDHDRVMEGR